MSSAPAPSASTGWDCHAHLFGPYEKFPLAPQRSYTPPEAVAAGYEALLSRLALGHGVLVHPSAYSDDFSLLFNALAQHPDWRGVMVLRPDSVMKHPLHNLHQRGIRGLRFSHRSGSGANFAGSASFDDLLALAPAMADAGLHAELWTDCKVLPDIEPALRQLPVPVVIDHMGGFDVDAGIDQPGFRSLQSLLASGRAWVKLCAYRNLLGRPDLEAGRPFQQALQRANPERLLWGSDWPHLRVEPAPDAALLLATFKRWADDERLAARVLEVNPGALYG